MRAGFPTTYELIGLRHCYPMDEELPCFHASTSKRQSSVT
jgi:hypothetical protein